MLPDAALNEIALKTVFYLGGLMVFGLVVVIGLTIASRNKSKTATLWARFGTLVVLGPVLLVPAYFGHLAFLGLISIICLLSLREFWQFLERLDYPRYRMACVVATGCMVVLTFYFGITGLLGCLAFLALGGIFFRYIPPVRERWGAKGWPFVATLLYIPGLLAFLWLVRMQDGGFGKVVFFLLVIQLSDVFAFVGGGLFGRTKLAPIISPGKSWEGLICGILGALGCAFCFRYTLPEFSLAEVLSISLVLAITGVCGDLFASSLKRASGLKDFGTLLKGHGGVLDRFDSYLISAPVGYFLLAKGYMALFNQDQPVSKVVNCMEMILR